MGESAVSSRFAAVAEAYPNTSGFVPLDLRVLVMPDLVEDKVGSIFLPEQAKEKEKYATVKATLVAVGENAWEEAASRSPNFTRPQPGDRVIIAKYGGILLTGADKADYRIMNDEDIIARLEE
jgi:co-chaperonin GroES (HSP10)